MDDKRYGNQKWIPGNKRGNRMGRLSQTILFITLLGAVLPSQTSAQNPCEEIGSDCRVLTAAEVRAFNVLVLAVKSLLPVPDASRYESNGAIEASTMPFVAEAKIAGGVMAGKTWQAGCFPYSPYNTLSFGYDAKAVQAKPSDKNKDKDPLAAIQRVASFVENKIELSVWLRPHSYLVTVEDGKPLDVADPEAYNIEKNAEFLTWQTGDDVVSLNMIFGPRTGNEEETLNTDKPSPKFAPLKSIELIISGPKEEVAALKKKIDRHAFAALLGPVVR